MTIIENAKCAIFADSSYMGMVVTYNKFRNVYITLAEVLKVKFIISPKEYNPVNPGLAHFAHKIGSISIVRTLAAVSERAQVRTGRVTF